MVHSNGNWVAVANSGWASGSSDFGVTWSARDKGLNTGSTITNFGGVETDGNGVFIVAGKLWVLIKGYCMAVTRSLCLRLG